MYPSCESLRSPGRLSPSAQQNFLPPTSPPNFPPPPSPPLEAGGNSRGYGDLLEAGYYNPQEDTTPPDYPPSPAGLVATVGVGELQDERLDSLHCIPLDLPSSPQPVFISCKPIYDLSLSIVTKTITITIIITITHVHMFTFFLPSFPLSLFLLSFKVHFLKLSHWNLSLHVHMICFNIYAFFQPVLNLSSLRASPDSSLLDPLPTYYDMSTSVSGNYGVDDC